jgi:hypothetical protein
MEEGMARVKDATVERIDRREFTATAVLALLSGVTVTVVGCGSSSPTAPTPGPGNRTGAVTANHGHAAVITGAQISAGNAVVLDIRGSADHPHTVQITMAEVGQIAAGQRVSKTSSTEASPTTAAHDHMVIFN